MFQNSPGLCCSRCLLLMLVCFGIHFIIVSTLERATQPKLQQRSSLSTPEDASTQELPREQDHNGRLDLLLLEKPVRWRSHLKAAEPDGFAGPSEAEDESLVTSSTAARPTSAIDRGPHEDLSRRAEGPREETHTSVETKLVTFKRLSRLNFPA